MSILEELEKEQRQALRTNILAGILATICLLVSIYMLYTGNTQTAIYWILVSISLRMLIKR